MSQWGRLRGNCVAQRADFKLSTLKNVRARTPGTVCTICQKKNHVSSFCPSAVTVVPEKKRIPFVENLLEMPREDITQYEGVPPEQVMARIAERARVLNRGNPFKETNLRADRLRAEAGMWKAIGADKATLSWICYGYDFKFQEEPGQFTFPNAPSYTNYASDKSRMRRKMARSAQCMWTSRM